VRLSRTEAVVSKRDEITANLSNQCVLTTIGANCRIGAIDRDVAAIESGEVCKVFKGVKRARGVELLGKRDEEFLHLPGLLVSPVPTMRRLAGFVLGNQ
jgi:hypothetical protein